MAPETIGAAVFANQIAAEKFNRGIFRQLALILIITVLASEIAIDPQPVHRPAMGDLQFAHDRHVVFGLAGDDARAAASTNIQIDRHAPLLGRIQRRMSIETR